MRDKKFHDTAPLKIPRKALDDANLTEATDDPDEREDDQLLWVVGEVHAESSPEERRLMRMSSAQIYTVKKD